MNTTKLVLAVIAIFASGVLTGGLATRSRSGERESSLARPFLRHMETKRHLQVSERRPTLPPNLRFEALQEQLSRMELSVEQRSRMDRILHDGRTRIREKWDSVSPGIQQEIRRMRREVREQLTMEQRRGMDEFFRGRTNERR